MHSQTVYIVSVFVMLLLMLVFTRLLPLLIAKPLKKCPTLMALGKELPPAIMWILVLDTLTYSGPHHNVVLLWQVAALVVTVLVHVWKRNLILSIACGTVVFLLAQYFFC